jgi:hypothetical protein
LNTKQIIITCLYFNFLTVASTFASINSKQDLIIKDSLILQNNIMLGAYYFDGWTGLTQHITDDLKADFPERKPKWGWITSTPSIIKAQINEASKHGISFFSFCWYYNKSDSLNVKKEPLNRALDLFLKAPNRSKLSFNLLVANHDGSRIGPRDWEFVTSLWIDYFKNSRYLNVNGRPLITIFDFKDLISKFGSKELVKVALERFKEKARLRGLPGANVAACISGGLADAAIACDCGFDILTAYNNHNEGFLNKKLVVPIDSLTAANIRVWNTFKSQTLPYIPAVTINWDVRPWGIFNKTNLTSARYEGFSNTSVYNQVNAVKEWLIQNSSKATDQQVAVIYAWNEYGEGAWLTPSANSNTNYLRSVKKALNGHN